jgi:SAM-dependent methyltransferase
MELNTLEAEAAFADSEYRRCEENLAINEKMFRKYSRPRWSHDWRELSARLLGALEGQKVLDFGCGMGEESTYFAKLGAHVTAIDISPVGIQIARKRAEYNGVIERVETVLADATRTPFADDTFDLVHGLGILHHVGLAPGLSEVRRVLKPGGSAVFLEPLGDVPFVESCKSWLHRRLQWRLELTKVTDDERNLRLHDIRKCTRQFKSSALYYFRLLYRARKLIVPQIHYETVQWMDWQLLRFGPCLRPFAGAVLIHVTK